MEPFYFERMSTTTENTKETLTSLLIVSTVMFHYTHMTSASEAQHPQLYGALCVISKSVGSRFDF